ncbi:PREDICTED: cilia- and flagella-associated protein 45-like [Nicotiana attenuata]|uniref:cilia- and flagella-associated protein 45-like n=1 Tax=Nicotiana attenuata TaxID=49451 RepID=UPI0009056C3D|nr:PREDICTED: cilia- and flagella-associated protein 45-like [Nicotiana attenuata]
MRPAPLGEETKSPIPKSGKDNKRKGASKPEDPQDKRAPTQRQRRKLIHVDIDSVNQLNDEEEDEGEESALVTRARKPVEAVKPSEPETLPQSEETPNKNAGKDPESPEVEIVPPPLTSIGNETSTEIPEAEESTPSDMLGAMKIGHSPPLPAYSQEAIKEAQALQTPDPSAVPGEEYRFWDCFTGVDDAADLNDASTLFEEAHRLFSQFRAELSQCEAELKKSSDEGKALKLLCSQKEEELKDLRADLVKASKNKAELDKQVTIILKEYSLLDPTVEANTSVSQLQQKLEMIKQLQGEVDQVKADYNRWKEYMDRLAAEKEATLAKMASIETQIRGAKEKNLAQAKKIDELEAKLAATEAEVAEAGRGQEDEGFDLTEELAQAKALEADTKFLISSSDDDDDEGSQSGSDNEVRPKEEAAPAGETSPGHR